MASYRHLARIAVMQALFAYEFREGVDPDEMLKLTTTEFSNKLKDDSFAKELLKGVLTTIDDVQKIIQEEAPEWPIEKIAPVDRAILEIGIYEILFSQDVPPIVAINEGVEIAKSYGDTNAPKFVNGVLSTVMHKYSDKIEKSDDNKK
ncbi:transcription antitermination factor NusB [Pseudomonadota bacterium]